MTADLYGCRFRLKKNRGAVSKARCNQLHRCTVLPTVPGRLQRHVAVELIEVG
jgi:hypothetical protein